jgi:hypothetical protein
LRFWRRAVVLRESCDDLIGNRRLRAESRAKLPGIANVKNSQFRAAEGRVSRNFLQLLAFATGIFPSRSLSARLTLSSAPLSISLMPEDSMASKTQPY